MPTMYFIGVTTAESSINAIFPRWADALGLDRVRLVGMDFVPHDDPARYRAAVRHIKGDADSLGALVTTHKMDLFAACRELFDSIDPLAESMGEIASIYKRDGKLFGRAIDPVNSGRSLNTFCRKDHWQTTGGNAQVCILGAGGASLALSWHLLTQLSSPENRPARLIISDISPSRIDHIRTYIATLKSPIPVEYHVCSGAADNDALVSALPAGSLVVNATGLGKDAPGSPLTENAIFPNNAIVWEFNYRGNLVFLDQAKAQAEARHLQIVDGWTYFVHGWSSVIADVFDIPITADAFNRLSAIAAESR